LPLTYTSYKASVIKKKRYVIRGYVLPPPLTTRRHFGKSILITQPPPVISFRVAIPPSVYSITLSLVATTIYFPPSFHIFIICISSYYLCTYAVVYSISHPPPHLTSLFYYTYVTDCHDITTYDIVSCV